MKAPAFVLRQIYRTCDLKRLHWLVRLNGMITIGEKE